MTHLVVGDQAKLYAEGTTPMFDQAREQSDRDNPRRSPRIVEKAFAKPNLHINIPENSEKIRSINNRRGG